MFYGESQNAIDAKGRTSVPAKFRDVLAKQDADRVFVMPGPDRQLWCYPPKAWQAFVEKVGAMPQFSPVTRELNRKIVNKTEECVLDKMGRILVPQSLREFAGLRSDVVWTGSIGHMELWAAERRKLIEEQDQSGAEDPAFAETLGKLGL